MDYLAILLALTPVFLLIILLGFLKIPGDKSALYTLIVTIFLSAFRRRHATTPQFTLSSPHTDSRLTFY